MKKKKILVVLLSSMVILIGGYFGWKLYQNTTRTIIPVDDLEKVSIKRENNQLLLVGKAKLDPFERVANYGAIQINDTLYIYVMKTKSLIKEDVVKENLTKISVSDSPTSPKKIYLVSGKHIEVKEKDNPEMDYMDVTKYSEKRELIE